MFAYFPLQLLRDTPVLYPPASHSHFPSTPQRSCYSLFPVSPKYPRLALSAQRYIKKQSPPFHPPIRPTLTATSLSNLFQNPSNRLLEDKKKSKTALAPRRYELGCILRILLFSDAISNKCCFHLTSYVTQNQKEGLMFSITSSQLHPY